LHAAEHVGAVCEGLLRAEEDFKVGDVEAFEMVEA
jgi:hypothetical protein